MVLFDVSWRKLVRYLLGLPRTNNCNMLHEICLDVSVDNQLIVRSFDFIRSLLFSQNSIANTCGRIAMRGSRSNVSNNVLVLCKTFNVMRHSFSSGCVERLPKHVSDNSALIRNLLVSRFESNFKPNTSNFLNYDAKLFMP